MARRLAEHAGGTVAHWLHEVPEGLAYHTDRCVRRVLAERARAAARAGDSMHNDPDDPVVVAVGRYKQYAERLRAVKK